MSTRRAAGGADRGAVAWLLRSATLLALSVQLLEPCRSLAQAVASTATLPSAGPTASARPASSLASPGSLIGPPTNPRIVQALRRQLLSAQRAWQDGRHEEAMQGFAVAYAFSPTLETLGRLAESAHRAEHYAEALTLYERLRLESPDAAIRGRAGATLQTLRAILVDEEVDAARLVREQLETARRAFQGRAYEAATRAYAMAYAMKRLPRLLFNMAQAERRSRNLVEAYLMYERLLQEEPGSQVRSEAEGYLTELRPVLNRPPLYKQPWFWGGLAGGIVVTSLAVGLGVGLSQAAEKNVGTLQLTF